MIGSPSFSKVLIVGAGPCGLLLAVFLGKAGVQVTVLESWPHLDTRLRATQYGVPATRIFKRAGLLSDIRAASIESFPSICWRRTSDHQRLTGIDLSVVKDDDERMTVLPLNSLVKIIHKHCMERTNGMVEVLWEHAVKGVSQDADKAWVDVFIKNEKETRRLEADYVVGCDGSTSAVRHALFGRNWPGKTFDCHLMVQNVWYDGFEKHGWDGGNYMIDPDYWGLIAKRGKGGLWRVTYGDVDGLTNEEYEKRRETAFEKLLPGHPKPDQYTIPQTDHFRSHNRCVESMRVGRVLLAGDAAHVNNPWGGYGCMAAVLDAGGLADCLIGMYQEIRREKYLKYIDVRSTRNMDRVRNAHPEHVLQTDKFLGILQDLEGDPEATRKFLLKPSSIEYDFTQHFRKVIDFS